MADFEVELELNLLPSYHSQCSKLTSEYNNESMPFHLQVSIRYTVNLKYF